jgi:hypothetical protein
MVVDTKFNDDNNLNMNGVIFFKNKLDIEFGADEFMYIFPVALICMLSFRFFKKIILPSHFNCCHH